MSCKPAYFNGWGTCSSLMKKMKGGALQTKGNTWTDAQAIDSSVWHTAIADDDNSVRDTLMLKIHGFVNTTDEPAVLTSALGKKVQDGKPIPSGTLQLDASICDYKTLHDLQGTQYEFIPFFEDGSYWLTRKSDGTLKGLRMNFNTLAGLPPEDRLNSFPMYMFFDDYEEFENIVVVSPEFTFSDLLNYSPAGVDIRVTTDYTGGDVVITATKRGSGDPMTTMTTTADWQILKSNATPTVAVTAVSGGELGVYTLTVKKDNDGTPANLASTDRVYLQAQDDDTTYVTHLSPVLSFNGGA